MASRYFGSDASRLQPTTANTSADRQRVPDGVLNDLARRPTVRPTLSLKRATWDEARARVAEHPEGITVVYLADGVERSAVWSNRPDIVFGTGHCRAAP